MVVIRCIDTAIWLVFGRFRVKILASGSVRLTSLSFSLCRVNARILLSCKPWLFFQTPHPYYYSSSQITLNFPPSGINGEWGLPVPWKDSWQKPNIKSKQHATCYDITNSSVFSCNGTCKGEQWGSAACGGWEKYHVMGECMYVHCNFVI